MSLETWKAEFYPTEAKDCPAEQAITHSLRKWEGLLSENLAKHELAGGGCTNISSGASSLRIDAESCALCVHHFMDDNEADICPTCPLSEYNGTRCDWYDKTGVSLYFHGLENPLIMITALKETLKANS